MGATCTYWGFVLRSGDAMSGNLAMGGNKITGLGAGAGAGEGARYEQLESQVHARVSKAGDAMTGNLAMGGNKVTGLGTPTAQDDALRRGRTEVAQGDLKLSLGSWSGAVGANTAQTVGFHSYSHLHSLQGSLYSNRAVIGGKNSIRGWAGPPDSAEGLEVYLHNEWSAAQNITAKWTYHAG